MIGKCPSPGEILALADGTLDGTLRRELEEHIATCAECALEVAGVREAVQELRGVGGTRLTETKECPEWELVAAYADGSVSGDEAARAESHLAGCPWCLALVADLWRLGEGGAGPSEDSIPERVLGALVRRARTAVVRWADDTFSVVRGFAAGLKEGVQFPERGDLIPEGAVRGGSRVRFGWEDGDGVVLECEVRLLEDRPALGGRVTASGAPARGLSVALRGVGEDQGPESPDALGRFGPWPIAPGRHELVLCGACLEGGRAELGIELVDDGA